MRILGGRGGGGVAKGHEQANKTKLNNNCLKYKETTTSLSIIISQLAVSYPGCQGLFMRGFRFSRGFAAHVFGLRPNTCRPAADETNLPDAREKKPLVPRVAVSTLFRKFENVQENLSPHLKTDYHDPSWLILSLSQHDHIQGRGLKGCLG